MKDEALLHPSSCLISGVGLFAFVITRHFPGHAWSKWIAVLFHANTVS